jgi:undecaprenyl-diphosphatase
VTLGQLDLWLFARVNAAAGTSGWRLEGATDLAQALVYLVPAALLGFWFAGGTARRQAAVSALAAASGALLVNQLIALAWYRPRPFAAGIGRAFLQHVADSSFPSDHVTVLAATGFALLSARAALGRASGAALLAAALVVGWARVYLGLHYPGDIVVALAVAGLAAAATRSRVGRSLCAALTSAGERIHRRLFANAIARGWMRA